MLVNFVLYFFIALISSSHFYRYFHRFSIYLSPPSSLIAFILLHLLFFFVIVRCFPPLIHSIRLSMSSYFFGRSFILFVIYIFFIPIFSAFALLRKNECEAELCEYGVLTIRWLFVTVLLLLFHIVFPFIHCDCSTKINALLYRTVCYTADLILAGPHTVPTI